MRKSIMAVIAIGIVLALSVPVFGMAASSHRTTVDARTMHRNEGVNIVFLAPVANMTSFYGGATLPVRVLLQDTDDSLISGANVTILVNGQPATSTVKMMTGNTMIEIHYAVYLFNLNTKPYPAGPGSAPIDIGVLAKLPDDRAFEAHKLISLN